MNVIREARWRHSIGLLVVLRISFRDHHAQSVISPNYDFDLQYYRLIDKLRYQIMEGGYQGKLHDSTLRIIECSHPHLPKNYLTNVTEEVSVHIKPSVSSTLITAVKTLVARFLKFFGRANTTPS